MLSLLPKWWQAVREDKDLELRKSYPKSLIKDDPHKFSEDGFKVYVYESRGSHKVVGEFTCRDIVVFSYNNFMKKSIGGVYDHTYHHNVSIKDLAAYFNDPTKPVYGWCISDVVIYDTPKDLSDFDVAKAPMSWCYCNEQAA